MRIDIVYERKDADEFVHINLPHNFNKYIHPIISNINRQMRKDLQIPKDIRSGKDNTIVINCGGGYLHSAYEGIIFGVIKEECELHFSKSDNHRIAVVPMKIDRPSSKGRLRHYC